MKVAVITFFQTKDNYGQLLQCYALQEVLRRIGHTPYLIRYGFHQQYFHWFKKKNFFTKSGLHATVRHIRSLIAPTKDPKDRGFDAFRSEYLSQSKRSYNSLLELQRNPPVADCYITGSDQVWAQLLSNRNNRSFFLDFGPKNVLRVSYAPSFAVENYPEALNEELSFQLSRFNAISVREYSGVRICNSVGYNATLVLDPTLLLGGSDYISMMKGTQHKDLYCFVYHVNVTSKEELYWDKFSEYNHNCGFRSIAVFANPVSGVKMDFLDDADYVYPTIGEWLRYIGQSQYVLTSSFHGIVFSILLHKPFVACLRKEAQFSGNDRVMTLLSMLHLEDRIMSQSVSADDVLSKDIDWEGVDMTLQNFRKKSVSFLKESLR